MSDFSEEGYLKNLMDWSDEILKAIAVKEKLTLTDEHIAIIKFVRNFYLENGTHPAIRIIVNTMKQKLPAEKATGLYLHKLFPGDTSAAKQIAKLAGLPKPIRCV